ncbi:MAG: AAA family ATPase [Christensenellaceae bacterium]|nr:AAA family ATPase [Christensenellaceae bacterium]
MSKLEKNLSKDLQDLQRELSSVQSELNDMRDVLDALKKEIAVINAQKVDSETLLNKEKDLSAYVSRLEGIISGYAVSFNNTLSSYRAALKDEVKIMSSAALESNIVSTVVGKATDLMIDTIQSNYDEKITSDEALSKSLEQVIEILKHDLIAKVYEKEDLVTVKPLRGDEYTHEAFPKLLGCLKAGIIPMLVGPAGTGKSTAVEQAARALNLRFYTANRVQNAFELTGYTDAVGKYVPTQFYEAYRKGGIFFFDEVDSSTPEALVTINTAVSQGYMAFPGFTTPVQMHKDFKMVAAGNTYGNGASREYCGRNALDAATLDRFMVIEWNYDYTLEKNLIDDAFLLSFCWGLRDVIQSSRIHIIISTRGILATLTVLRQSDGAFTVADAVRGNLFEGLGKDTVTKLIGGLDALDKQNAGKIHSSYLYSANPYYIATKTLISVLK